MIPPGNPGKARIRNPLKPGISRPPASVKTENRNHGDMTGTKGKPRKTDPTDCRKPDPDCTRDTHRDFPKLKVLDPPPPEIRLRQGKSSVKPQSQFPIP